MFDRVTERARKVVGRTPAKESRATNEEPRPTRGSATRSKMLRMATGAVVTGLRLLPGILALMSAMGVDMPPASM